MNEDQSFDELIRRKIALHRNSLPVNKIFRILPSFTRLYTIHINPLKQMKKGTCYFNLTDCYHRKISFNKVMNTISFEDTRERFVGNIEK